MRWRRQGGFPDIDLIIVATSTPDMVFCPLRAFSRTSSEPTAVLPLTCRRCSGLGIALTLADSMIQTGAASKALVIGAEVFSRILDFKDRTTWCVVW